METDASSPMVSPNCDVSLIRINTKQKPAILSAEKDTVSMDLGAIFYIIIKLRLSLKIPL